MQDTLEANTLNAFNDIETADTAAVKQEIIHPDLTNQIEKLKLEKPKVYESMKSKLTPDEIKQEKAGKKDPCDMTPELYKKREQMNMNLNLSNIIVADMNHLDAPGSFICTGHIHDSVCDEIIEFYNRADYLPHRPGMTSSGVDVNNKHSVDLMVMPLFIHDRRTENYFKGLNHMLASYMGCWKGSAISSCNIELDPICNIQSYPAGGAYFSQHCERQGSHVGSVNRVLAWMTYLNDVEEGGETSFVIQNIKIKPKKGLTLIWPSDWTHTHKGLPAPNQTKQIITGWFNFASPMNPHPAPDGIVN